MSPTAPSLPPLLAPWRAWLAPLADDARDWLGAALLQLRPLLPAPGAATEQRLGEFAGYRGISRRGLPERLLATEWLYAQELPDEFLRRYGSGESLHLEPAREDPAAERLQLLLFDSGPAQLGACRLAHLALWILLAQLAIASRQRWAFASLQDDPGQLCEDSGTGGWTRLLEARTQRAVQPADLAHWGHWLREARPGAIWLIAAAETPAPPVPSMARMERIEIAEPPQLEQRTLALASSRGRVLLPLPPPRLAARLLRDPLAAAPHRPVIHQAMPVWSKLPDLPLRHRVMFSGDGHRMLVRLADDRCVLQVVPNAPRSSVPDGKVLDTGPSTLAIRINRRSLIELRRLEDGSWQLRNALGLPGITTLPPDAQAPVLPGSAQWQRLWRCGDALLLLDLGQQLHAYRLASGGGIAHQQRAQSVIGLSVREESGRYSCVRSSAEGSWLDHGQGTTRQIEFPPARRAFLGEQLYLELKPQHWWTQGQAGIVQTFQLGPDEQVVGHWNRQLITRIPGRTGLQVYQRGVPRWMALPEEPLSPSISALGVLAYFSRDRELVLYSLSRQCELRRFRGGGGASP